MAIRFCLLLIFFGSMGVLQAQHHHYMFIQADQQQPFYVKMGTELLSSSKDGFLIIPRLKDSAYEMIIGFPEKKFPEYLFRFAGFRKDRGMALKNFQEKGWGLFDYQSMEVLMGEKQALPAPAAEAPIPPPLTSDPFTVILAGVIGDPGLLATPLINAGTLPGMVASNAVVRTTLEKPAQDAEKSAYQERPRADTILNASNAQAPADSGLIVSNAPPAVDSATQAVKALPMGDTTLQAAKVLPDLDSTAQVVKALPMGDTARQAMNTQPLTDTAALAAKNVGMADTVSQAAGQSSAAVVRENVQADGAQPSATQALPSEPGKKKRQMGGLFAGGILKRDKKKEPVPGAERPSPQSASPPVTMTESKKTDSKQADQAAALPAGDKPAPDLAPVRMHEEKREDSGLRRVYVDAAHALVPDTVDVWIPVEERRREEGGKVAGGEALGGKATGEKAVGEKAAGGEAVGGKNESTGVDSITERGTRKPDRVDCRKKATSADLNALRKKMVGISDEDEMVMAALRDIKQRCYTTDQVRDLCAVFTRDEGRYKLIDAAYRYVYDPSRYDSLEFLLSDKYFIHRFRALIQN